MSRALQWGEGGSRADIWKSPPEKRRNRRVEGKGASRLKEHKEAGVARPEPGREQHQNPSP